MDTQEMSVEALYKQLDREMAKLKHEENEIRRKRAFLDAMVESVKSHEEPGYKQLAMDMEESLDRGAEREFDITLGSTNYEQGFFNVPVKSDGLIMGDECRLSLPDGRKIKARITRNQNSNGTARIFGSANLKHWFRDNFDRGDSVSAYILNEDTILLGEHTAPITRLAEFLPAQSGLRS